MSTRDSEIRFYEFNCCGPSPEEIERHPEGYDVNSRFPDLRGDALPHIFSHAGSFEQVYYFRRQPGRLHAWFDQHIRKRVSREPKFLNLGPLAELDEKTRSRLWLEDTLDIFFSATDLKVLAGFVQMFPAIFGEPLTFSESVRSLPINPGPDTACFLAFMEKLPRQHYLISFWDEGNCFDIFADEAILEMIPGWLRE